MYRAARSAERHEKRTRRRTGKSRRARNETRRIAAHTYISATTRRLRPPVGQVKTEFSNYTDWQAPCCWVSGLFAARPCRLTPVTRRALVLNGTAIGTTNAAPYQWWLSFTNRLFYSHNLSSSI